MRCSYQIKNGRIIDPSRNIDQIGNIYISAGKIVAISNHEDIEADEIIDASGCLIVPGLIDFHTHLDRAHSDVGIHPDLMTLPNGITSAVDAGTTGSSNYEGFYKDVICSSDITMKSFLNVAATGIITEQYFENVEPAFYDIEKIKYLFDKYPEQILGLKVRIGKLFSKEMNLEPLIKTKELSNLLKTQICVHVVYPESPYNEILSYFDKGDILCHCFQEKGPYNILDNNGKVSDCVRDARARGVIFDGAAGRANYSFNIIRKALDDNFMPDVISTDVIIQTVYKRKVFSLPYTMSAYLALGMPIFEIIRAVTQNPARLMHMDKVIGTLAPGSIADVAIFKIKQIPLMFNDQFGNSVVGNKLLVPQMTIKAGKTAYMSIEFTFKQ